MKLLFYLLFFLASIDVLGQQPMAYDDKIRIREAIKAAPFGNKIWEGYNSVPFVILLVTDSWEYLINHPRPGKDFTSLGRDSILDTEIFYRKKVFNPHLLATFPAVNGVATIVVGSPENTNKGSVNWIITLLHEHFHQLQMTYPRYYENVNNLDLSGGDQTGMWMLNYPFPYDSIPVIKQYHKLSRALIAAVNSPSREFKLHFKNYVTERKKLKALLSPADYRYFVFQLWQEGIARYSEYKFLEALQKTTVSDEVAGLKDYIPFKTLKAKLYKDEMNNVGKMKLNNLKRISFYSLGFLEGLLMDKVTKNWRKEYLADIFVMENYMK